jgi:hypothetical protein
MTKARMLLGFGIWVAILPYLGFPYSWKNILFTVTGLLLIYFGYILYREHKAKHGIKKIFDNFSENFHFDGKNSRSSDE